MRLPRSSPPSPSYFLSFWASRTHSLIHHNLVFMWLTFLKLSFLIMKTEAKPVTVTCTLNAPLPVLSPGLLPSGGAASWAHCPVAPFLTKSSLIYLHLYSLILNFIKGWHSVCNLLEFTSFHLIVYSSKFGCSHSSSCLHSPFAKEASADGVCCPVSHISAGLV